MLPLRSKKLSADSQEAFRLCPLLFSFLFFVGTAQQVAGWRLDAPPCEDQVLYRMNLLLWHQLWWHNNQFIAYCDTFLNPRSTFLVMKMIRYSDTGSTSSAYCDTCPPSQWCHCRLYSVSNLSCTYFQHCHVSQPCAKLLLGYTGKLHESWRKGPSTAHWGWKQINVDALTNMDKWIASVAGFCVLNRMLYQQWFLKKASFFDGLFMVFSLSWVVEGDIHIIGRRDSS